MFTPPVHCRRKEQQSAGDPYTYRQIDCTDFKGLKAACNDANSLVHLAAKYTTHDHEEYR
jgi:hypothetical protein